MTTTRKSVGIALASLTLLAAILGGLWLFGRDQGGQTAYRQALHTTELVEQMGDALHEAARSEKQAVMAETDEESHRFARDARNATDTIARLLTELKKQPLRASGEGELVVRFEAAFAEYLRADEEVLALAVQNTNISALALSFGKAAGTLDEMAQALRPLLDGPNDSQARQAQRALSGALRIQSLHAPHILEKTDRRMDLLEKEVADSDKAVRQALAALGRDAAGAKALSAYERYWKLTGEIFELSRRNTNVRSLALSLERKTRVLATCDEALRALETNVRERMASMATR